ncbi:MAG TPA: M3 family metallopeptidase [Candidatus Eremiobacteraceae bacterium]|nr:M3 family metallopeptidase [Candidatus Eremiobacteraceae bacterium]
MKSILAIVFTALLYLPTSGSATTVSTRGYPTLIDWSLSAEQIGTSCTKQLAIARNHANRLAASLSVRTFVTTVLPLENLNADLRDNLAAQLFLSQVSPDKGIRDASLACYTKFAAFNAEENASPILYRALLTAQQSGTAPGLYGRRLTTLWVQTFEQAGAGLSAPKRADFVKLSNQLIDLQNRFNANFANDTTAIAISKKESAGLSSDFVASFKVGADGRYVVPVNDSTRLPFLANASDEAVRKRYYFAYGNVQAPANVKLLEQAIAIRDRLGRLLGFPTWAAYQMHFRTAKDPAAMMSFLDKLDNQLLPKAKAEIQNLQTLKASQTGDAHAQIQMWDVAYYQNQLVKTKYALDQNQVRQYFPAPHTVEQILAIYQKILGVTFAPVKPANNWNPDVTEFSVTDTASGKFIGSFLLDLYPRPGKPGGAFESDLLPVRRLADGTMRPPVTTIIVSDWPAPGIDTPALLTHEDVVTFFHEFGHCMAGLLARVPYESLTGFNQDFVEAPSQMLENFTWDPVVLKKLSADVDTGQPMPDAMIANMIAARCVTDRLCSAYAAARQVVYATADLDWHMSGPAVDTTKVWARVQAAEAPIPLPNGVYPQAQDTHWMSGYDAGVYVYMWSLVYAQDMFTAFQKGGLDSPIVGMRYRQTILAPAQSLDPDVEVANFLGRPMSTSAFYDGFNKRP